MKVSFDFDGVLTLPKIQLLAKSMITLGFDVWIITSRSEKSRQNHEIFTICDKIGLSPLKVIFTNCALKVNEFNRGSFDFHFDDCWDEVEAINENGGTAFLVNPDFNDLLCDEVLIKRKIS